MKHPTLALILSLLPALSLPADSDFDPTTLVLRTAPEVPSTAIKGDSDPLGTSQDRNQNFFDVTGPRYGAAADGITDNTTALQKALDDASASATKATDGLERIVVFPKGTFLSGPLSIGSHVFLKVEAGAVLKALPMKAYGAKIGMILDGRHKTASKDRVSFLTNSDKSDGNTDLGVYGGGTIDGSGGNGSSDYPVFKKDTECWWGYYLTFRPGHFEDPRPRILAFTACTNLLVRDITLQNSASMHFTTSGGSHIVLSHVSMLSPAEALRGPAHEGTATTGDSPNTDGFDPGGAKDRPCTDIWVDHCTFDTGDDCIAVKALDGPVSNLFVINCTFKHGHGMSFGGQTTYGVSNVIVDSCTFAYTRYGLRIKSPRTAGGDCHDIQYSNLTLKGVVFPLWLTAYYPDETMPADNASEPEAPYTVLGTPYYHRILVQNVTIAGSPTAGLIAGVKEKPFDAIVLNNVVVEGAAGPGLVVRNAAVWVSSDSRLPPPRVQDQGRLTPFSF